MEKENYSNNCCESQVIEIKELDLLVVNIYRPPNAPKELFEDTLIKCQEAIDKVLENDEEKSKTVCAFGDYNFPFIKWPSMRFYSREEEPNHMASEKVQAKLLLEWAEQNFMNQIINTPTRKENILDLVFSNSDNLINGYSTIVNTSFSDHNILQIVSNYENKSEEKKDRKNPYPNTIYEYDLVNASEEDWIRYDVLLTKLSEDFDQKAEYETSEEKLNKFYNLVEQAVSTLFEKKEAFKN